MGFLRVSSDQFCLSDSTLTWQGGDKRKRRGKRGGGGGDYSREAIILNISVWRGKLIETQLLFEGTLRSWSSSLPFSKMEYKAGNHPSPTVSIQDNDVGFSPIQCPCKGEWTILFCWVKVVCVYEIYFLWDWTSVNVGSSLAAPIRSLVVLLFRTQPWLMWTDQK